MRFLTQEFKELRLPGMADAWEHWQSVAANADRGAEACVAFLLDAQRQSVGQNRSDGFFRSAGLATHFSLQTFVAGLGAGLSAQHLDHLKGLSWVARGQTVVITGPTRSGKTHLAAGIGQEAMLQSIRTTFIQVPRMLERCLDADDTARRRYLKQLASVPLLIMDDFATEHASTERTYLLRRLLDERDRRRLSTVVASINTVSDWDDYFEDPSAREGIYARLLDGECHRIELKRRPVPKAAHPGPQGKKAHSTRATTATRKHATP